MEGGLRLFSNLCFGFPYFFIVTGCVDGFILEQSCKDENFCSQLGQNSDYKSGGLCCRSAFCNTPTAYQQGTTPGTAAVTDNIVKASSAARSLLAGVVAAAAAGAAI